MAGYKIGSKGYLDKLIGDAGVLCHRIKANSPSNVENANQLLEILTKLYLYYGIPCTIADEDKQTINK